MSMNLVQGCSSLMNRLVGGEGNESSNIQMDLEKQFVTNYTIEHIESPFGSSDIEEDENSGEYDQSDSDYCEETAFSTPLSLKRASLNDKT